MTTPNNQTPQASEAACVSEALLLRLHFIITAGLVLASVASFAFLLLTLWHFTVDDAFITFRYAENTVKGWGITFNLAPPRAEGYTSILWTLIMAIPHFMGIDAVLFSKLTGVCLTILTISVMTYGTLVIPAEGRNKNRTTGTAFASALFLAAPYGPVHAVSGMETALAAFLYALTTMLFLKGQGSGFQTAFLPMSCLLLGLTRPEANLFSLILMMLAMFNLPVTKRWRFAVKCFVFYILPGAVYFIGRYYYYGVLLPLPFYIKANSVALSGLGEAVSFVMDFGLALAIPVFLFITKAPIKQALVLLPITLVFGYFVTTQHIMGYGHRYFYPIVPALTLLAGLGMSAEIEHRLGARTTVVLFLCVMAALVFGFMTTFKSAQGYVSYTRGMNTGHVLLGRTLAEVPWSSKPVIAIGDAGAVPYYSRLETIDTYGLNDPTIAKDFRGDRSDYIFSMKPTVLVLISRYRDTFESPLDHENALFGACVEQGYSRHVTFVFSTNYYLWVMWRPDSQDAHVLDKALMTASRRSHEMSSIFANKALEDDARNARALAPSRARIAWYQKPH